MVSARMGRIAGVLSVVVALGTTLLATIVSPSFRWTEHALSELGVTWTAVGTPTTVALFNGGLVAGAGFGLGFAWFLRDSARSDLGRATAVAFGVTTASMGAVGVFQAGAVLHAPVAVTFFLFVTVTLGLAAASALRWDRSADAGDRVRYGATSLLLAATNLGIWVVWLALGGPAAAGLAVPEIGGSLVLSAWVLLTARQWPVWE